ncbi:MAG: DUF294 nucleotidyltransferase-like domain-containing protein [Methyloceanibacter sp.]|jgi:hypothetical protein
MGATKTASSTQSDPKADILLAARNFSKEKIASIANALGAVDKDCCVAITGSYGRLEASTESDFDYFIMTSRDPEASELKEFGERVGAAVRDRIGKLPSAGGPFHRITAADSMTRNIGGQHEKNEDLTRRILLLIEGRPVAGEAYFRKIRSDIISRYISEEIKTHQLGLFFLNDLIRYYRTMCVDFEYKTIEEGKSWGDRNIKLVFSRKLI